jgi:aryl-alcohol dehydrogenase-like predicted oxidoreductase
MKLGLGTVQFGLNYGISNTMGVTISEEVKRILEFARQNGIILLDTAPAYGTSEETLGNSLPDPHNFLVVTKTPTFRKTRIYSSDGQYLKETLHTSLNRLKQSSLYCLLIHHADNLFLRNGDILWEAMEEIKAAGLVKKIGVSVYSPQQIDKILDRYSPDVIQAPINVLDQRLIKAGYLAILKKQGIEIHSRSVFLQGLLLMPVEEMPDYFNPFKPMLAHYQESIKEKGGYPRRAAVGFVYCLPDIDYIIVGVNSKDHLEEINESVSNIDTLERLDFSEFAIDDERLVNPSLWKV